MGILPLREKSNASSEITMKFLADDSNSGSSHSFYSGSLVKRKASELSILPQGTNVSQALSQEVFLRLGTWDPYWACVQHISIAKTTTPTSISTRNGIKTCLSISFNVPQLFANDGSIPWGSGSEENAKIYKSGQQRLILRMLPLEAPKKYPDTHAWPKGTFLQFNSKPIHLLQRKQQSHDDTLWKGMCHPLDVTPFTNAHETNRIEVCTYDDAPYYLHLGIMEYQSPQDLYRNVHKKATYEQSLTKAKEYFNRQTVCIDDGDDGSSEQNDTPLTFSLVCPMSMTKIQTPVRGKKCDHIQTFDLMTYLQLNSKPCGTRWKCAICEKFTSVHDLVQCALSESLFIF